MVFRDAGVLEQAHRLRAEFCVAVEGVVEARPEGNANPEIATGEIEVNATSLTVLGESGAAAVPARRDRGRGSPARTTATSICAAKAPATQCGCAPR